MKQEFKNQFQRWYEAINKDKDFLILSNDLDSLLSCNYLKSKFGVEIGAFYDFKKLVYNKDITKGKNPIWVDVDVTKSRAFGNHVTLIENPDCINLNNKISNLNYTEKYAGSTYLTILSLFDEDLSNKSDDELMLILCIDAGYKGYYIPRFRDAWIKWIETLGYPELIDLVSRCRLNQFEKMQGHYKLYEHIRVHNDYKLHTDADLFNISWDLGFDTDTPEILFDKLKYTFDAHFSTNSWGVKRQHDRKEINVFSSAIVGRDKVAYSTHEKG